MNSRNAQLTQWLQQQLSADIQIAVLVGDASFRRYFRVTNNKRQQWVAMDAPPEHENCKPFCAIARSFREHHILAPEIIAEDHEQGFLLLSDFGDHVLLPALNTETVDGLYDKAMDVLLEIQQIKTIPHYTIPYFNEAHIRYELNLIIEWYFEKLCQITLTYSQHELLESLFHHLTEVLTSQPQVLIHRDYHSRNIMLVENGQLGILDFQDAMIGPVSYDLVSLLKDCYITWPRQQQLKWLQRYLQKAQQKNLLSQVSETDLIFWFDAAGLQRHIKVLGIFARLALRDNKKQYLNDIPRIKNYVTEVLQQYPFWQPLQALIP